MKVSIQFVLLLLSSFLASSPFLRADGGTVRLSERQGSYQITVFTAPIPLRAGPVDVSVLVQDVAKGGLVADAKVTVQVAPRGRLSEAVCYPATIEAATNKLFYAALFELPVPGWWEVQITIEGPRGPAQAHLEVEAAESLPQWLSVWPWYCWPALVIVLFGMHQVLARRRVGLSAQEAVTRGLCQPSGGTIT